MVKKKAKESIMDMLAKAKINADRDNRERWEREGLSLIHIWHKRFISVNLIENIAVVILICIVSIFISNASVGIALLIGSSVSYTHLDVYKRQVMH